MLTSQNSRRSGVRITYYERCVSCNTLAKGARRRWTGREHASSRQWSRRRRGTRGTRWRWPG